VRKAAHTKLWQNRYIVFTNEENLSTEQRQTLDELLAEHADSLPYRKVVLGCLLGACADE